MPQVSRRHHYLPEFYLKRWTSGGGTLVEFSKPHGNTVISKRVHPKQTGFKDWLYALHGVPPNRSDAFENRFFSPVDNKAAMVLQKMEAGITRFDTAERVAWSDFLMSLVLRHPESVEAVHEHMTANVAQDRAKPDQARWCRSNDDPATVQEILRQLGTEVGISMVALNTLSRSIKSAKIGSALINTQWGVLRAPQFAPALLTSDRPLLWANGIADRNFHLLLPIGPATIFYVVRPGSDMEARLNWLNTAALVGFMNEHVTRRAIRYVYGRSDWHLSYVQAHMGVNPRPTLIDQLLEQQRMRDGVRRASQSRKT